MKKFMNAMEKHFIPVASKIGSQRHLVAIRDGFVSIMPLILAGSFAVLLNSTLVKWIPALDFLGPINGNVWLGSLAIMTLLVVFSIGYNLAKSYDVDPLAAGLISIASFIVVTPLVDGGLPLGYLNATGLFTGIIVSLLATEIFVKVIKKDIVIKMPDTVPPAVGRAFVSVIPGIITVYIFAIIPIIITKLGGTSLYDIILNSIQRPLEGFSQGIISSILFAMLISIFWFFGLHGGNIMDPVINALYLPALEANATAVQQGLEATNIVTKVFFDAYVHLGGAGATLALIVAIYIGSKKRKEYREVAKLSTGPGLFQINEPIMFGIPIVLNPILFIPYFIIPGVLTLIAYLATALKLVPMTYVAIPWTTPPVLGGFLATGGNVMGGLLALINFVVAIIIYLPFVLLADRYTNDDKELVENKG